eukprot:5253690-Ditylum_brightwellii.AAC.1
MDQAKVAFPQPTPMPMPMPIIPFDASVASLTSLSPIRLLSFYSSLFYSPNRPNSNSDDT